MRRFRAAITFKDTLWDDRWPCWFDQRRGIERSAGADLKSNNGTARYGITQWMKRIRGGF
jgi:hypothetical protein